MKVLIAAYCPLIGDELFEELVRDGYGFALQAKPHIPDQLRASLRPATMSTQDPKTLVRFAGARNPQASPVELEILARDPRPMVRAAVASHPRISENFARLLLGDQEPDVREGLLRRIL